MAQTNSQSRDRIRKAVPYTIGLLLLLGLYQLRFVFVNPKDSPTAHGDETTVESFETNGPAQREKSNLSSSDEFTRSSVVQSEHTALAAKEASPPTEEFDSARASMRVNAQKKPLETSHVQPKQAPTITIYPGGIRDTPSITGPTDTDKRPLTVDIVEVKQAESENE